MKKPIEISGTLLVRNTILNFMGIIIPLLVGLVSMPYILKGLGPERFGLLSLSWTVLGFFSIFDLGLGRATTKFVAEALGKNELNKISAILFLAVIIQAIFGLVGTFIFRGMTPFLIDRVLNIPAFLLAEGKNTFYILSFSIPLVLISSSFMGILAAFQRFDLLNLLRIPSVSLYFVLPIIGVKLNFSVTNIVLLLICSKALFFFIYLILSIKIIPQFKIKITVIKKIFKNLLSFGGWVAVSNIISPLLVYIERFFIGSLLTLSAVGYYTAPSEMITRFSVIPSSLAMVLFPAFSFIGDRNKEHLNFLFVRAIKYLILGMGFLIVLMVLFAKEFLTIWIGADIASQSVYVVKILAIGVLINSLARIPLSLLQSLGRPDITAKFHILELPLHIPIVWILVRKIGITGAALAWTIRVSIDAGLLFIACFVLNIAPIQKFVKESTKKNLILFSYIIGAFLIAFIMGDNVLHHISFAIFFIAIFCIITWRYALDLKEKGFLMSFLLRFFHYVKKSKAKDL